MKLHSSVRIGIPLFFVPLAIWGLAIGIGHTMPVVTSASHQQEISFRGMAPTMNLLHKMVQKFDANHDQILSSQEQEAMADSIAKSYGSDWDDRLRRFLRAADLNGDGIIELSEWSQAVFEVKRLAKTPDPTHKATTYRVPMRDGVHLATDVYFPEGDGPFPVIISRTPYGRMKRTEGATNFAAAGYVAVIQDMRGRFDSEGENFPFIGCGWNEHQDGVDTIRWVMSQKWCNGRIGTVGGSAGGITQNLLAGATPEGLQAQYITVAAASLYSDASYLGGAYRKADADGWYTHNKFDPLALEIIHGHPNYDDYWRRTDTSLRFEQMNVPAVHVGGWFDMFAQATINEFSGRQHAGADGSHGAQKLIIGPWTHSIGKMPVGELTFSHAERIPHQYSSGRWFDHYLRGVDNGIEKEPAVAYYVMGDTSVPGAPGNEWRYADDWPVPAKDKAAYLTADGQLVFEKPTCGGDTHVNYVFDPMNPCPTIGGNNLMIKRGPMDQGEIESRSDVVGFVTAPLAEPLEVTGRIKADLFVSSSSLDTDISVRLCDVYPDGKSYLIAEGMLRLRFRQSFEKPELLIPGKIEEVTVDCWSTSIILNKGHRIRATITSSNYPRFDLNPGTGLPWSDSSPKLVQTNAVYCSSISPSHIILPIVTNALSSRCVLNVGGAQGVK